MKRYVYGLVIIGVVAVGFIISSYVSGEPVMAPVIANAAQEGGKPKFREAMKRKWKERREARMQEEAQQADSADESADSDEGGKQPQTQDPNSPADPNAPVADNEAEVEPLIEEATADPNDPLAETDPMVAINLNNVEMKVIIGMLAEWTGKPIIPADEAMKIKVTIFSPKKVRRSKALSYIYDNLRMKGIIAEIGEDRIFLKPLDQAKLGQVPTLSIDEPLARIADRSMLVEKYFKVNNTSPARLVDVISPLTASYGHVTAIESTGVIAVIDTVENLLRIKRIIDQFDVAESGQIVEEIFKIQNGSPTEIVQVLELILSPSAKAKKKKPAAGKPKEGAATTVVIEAGDIPTVLLPIPRQNWIIARASAEEIERIRDWIERLDEKGTIPPEQTVIPVEFVDVREVAKLAREAIEEMGGDDLKANVVIREMVNAKQIVVVGSEEYRSIVERLVAEIDLPIEDIYKTKVFRLKHAEPEQVKENIEALYEGQSGSFYNSSYRRGSYSRGSRNVSDEDVVKVVTDKILNSVSVIASEENLRKITIQIEKWDKPIDLTKDQYRIVTLHNSDPVKMVELLSALFSESQERRRSIWEMWYGGGDEKKKIVGNLYGLLTFEEVPGTKKILIISKVPEAYDVIEKLIKDLDSQEKGEIPRVVTLNYADAEELCDQINGILNEPGTRSQIPRKRRGLSYTVDEQAEGTTANPNAQENDTVDMITPWWDSVRRRDDEMPTSNLIGKIRLVPVHRSKAILVLSPPEYIEEIEAMIKELDQPGKQVMIEAVIVEVDHASMTSLGVKLASDPASFGALGENAVTALSQFATAENRAVFNPGIAGGAGVGALSQGFSSNFNVNVLVDLLAKTINAKVLNQPNLWTKDNEEAEFFKGEEFAITTGDQESNQGGGLSRSFDRTQVGVTLRVRPSITPEKDVDVTINLEISDKSAELVNGEPVIKRLSTSTNLIIKDGETIMLGGILFQTDSEVRTKVPLLGDIPLLGGLFRHKEKALSNSELLVFITPHVIDGNTSDAARRHIEEPKERMESVRIELDGALMQIEN